VPEVRLAVGGLVPFTTIDFPGRLAAVIFCQGCPWRCGYCHNPHLLRRGPGTLAWPDVRAWLATRRGLLDGVVFSGGEPLLQRGLAAALDEVRALGFATALHTAGAHPRRLAALLPRLDWVGFDVKAPFAEYASVVGCEAGRAARAALALLLASGVAHELRCTVPPALSDATLDRLRADLDVLGAGPLKLQACRPPGAFTPAAAGPCA
jgi:pyruvate formate lyase activating enzyme